MENNRQNNINGSGAFDGEARGAEANEGGKACGAGIVDGAEAHDCETRDGRSNAGGKACGGGAAGGSRMQAGAGASDSGYSGYMQLYEAARKAAENAYAPYSGFRVGAAVLSADGAIFTGVNVENASYGATICAERAALAAAVTAGKRKFEAVAVASSQGSAYPCGICRQAILEFGSDIKIITGDCAQALDVSEIEDLLPKGFRL